jgi:hypothetical protein
VQVAVGRTRFAQSLNAVFCAEQKFITQFGSMLVAQFAW